MFKTRSPEKKQAACDHLHLKENTICGLRRVVCVDCGHVSLESVADTVTNDAVSARRK